MGLVPALNHPTSGTANPVTLTDNDDAIRTVVNGQIDENNITAASITATSLASNAVTTAKITDANVTAAKLADAAKLGLDDGTSVRRGKCIIATEESTTSAAYTTLTTPDRVQNLVLPSDGLIFVAVHAMMKGTTSGGYAALFVGANQLKSYMPQQAAPQANEINSSWNVNQYGLISTSPAGLIMSGYLETDGSYSNPAYTGDVSTGQALGGTATAYYNNPSPYAAVTEHGGILAIFAAAGTYDISLKFKASSGTTYAKERKLWVWTMGF